jgi:hypothetical protein
MFEFGDLPPRTCKVNELEASKSDFRHRFTLLSSDDDTCEHTMRAAGLSVHVRGAHFPDQRSLQQIMVDPHTHF